MVCLGHPFRLCYPLTTWGSTRSLWWVSLRIKTQKRNCFVFACFLSMVWVTWDTFERLAFECVFLFFGGLLLEWCFSFWIINNCWKHRWQFAGQIQALCKGCILKLNEKERPKQAGHNCSFPKPFKNHVWLHSCFEWSSDLVRNDSLLVERNAKWPGNWRVWSEKNSGNKDRPPKLNMEPEKQPLKKRKIMFLTLILGFQTFIFNGGSSSNDQLPSTDILDKLIYQLVTRGSRWVSRFVVDDDDDDDDDDNPSWEPWNLARTCDVSMHPTIVVMIINFRKLTADPLKSEAWSCGISDWKNMGTLWCPCKMLGVAYFGLYNLCSPPFQVKKRDPWAQKMCVF